MMKPTVSGLLVSLMLGPSLAGAAPRTAAAEVRVVATVPTLAAIARDIGGERVSVKSIARGGEDPHFVNAKPSFMLDLRKADLFVEVGLELELGWAPILLQGARNASIAPGGLGFVDCSAGIAPLDVPTKPTRAEGDVHPLGNPHYWLDPLNGIVIARNIAAGLERVDPEGAPLYRERLADFSARLEAGTRDWQETLAPFRDAEAIPYHRLWPYFEQRFGIRFPAELEPKPGIPPSPRHLAELTELMKARRIGLVVNSPYSSAKPGTELARIVGGRAGTYPAGVEDEPEVTSYFELFEVLVRRFHDDFTALGAGAGDTP